MNNLNNLHSLFLTDNESNASPATEQHVGAVRVAPKILK